MLDLNKIYILLKYFGLYGYGHFGLTPDEILEVLTVLNGSNPENRIKKIYERLERDRMG